MQLYTKSDFLVMFVRNIVLPLLLISYSGLLLGLVQTFTCFVVYYQTL